jgi:hypothetical protein
MILIFRSLLSSLGGRIEDASGGPGQLPLNPLYAESFRVNTSCYLINVTAYMQPQGDNPDGDDILIRVFNATNNGGVAKPGGTPSIGYLHQQTQELTENVIFVYLTFSFSNLFLNTSNTYDNTFFISFTRLGAITPSNILIHPAEGMMVLMRHEYMGGEQLGMPALLQSILI